VCVCVCVCVFVCVTALHIAAVLHCPFLRLTGFTPFCFKTTA